MSSRYTINGYEVRCCYAGIDQYTIYKDGKEVATTWSIADVAQLTETDAETVKSEMWKQR